MGTNEILNCEVHDLLLSGDMKLNNYGGGTTVALEDYKSLDWIDLMSML